MLQFPVSRIIAARVIVMVTLFVARLTLVNMSAGFSRYSSAAADSSWRPAAGVAETSEDVVELLDESTSLETHPVETDVLDELTRLFGIAHLSAAETDSPSSTTRPPGQQNRHQQQHPRRSRHRAPPEYMVELYHAVAYTDGISKTANPYEADIVRGIADKGRYRFTAENTLMEPRTVVHHLYIESQNI